MGRGIDLPFLDIASAAAFSIPMTLILAHVIWGLSNRYININLGGLRLRPLKKRWMMTISNGDDCPVGADVALERLMDGNARFLRGEPRFTRAPLEVLADLAKGQRPFATILGCSDSRVRWSARASSCCSRTCFPDLKG